MVRTKALTALAVIGLLPVGFADGVDASTSNVAGWGQDLNGQATPPGGGAVFVAIAGGVDHSLGLKTDGSIVGWGSNGFGESAPPDGFDFVAVSTGERHSIALKADGSIVGWGESHYGLLTAPSGTDYTAIAAGSGFGLALRSDGSIVSWGRSRDGEIDPPAGQNYSAIAAGLSHGVALTAEGSLVGFGYNDEGQATPPTGNDYTAIAAGGAHGLALRDDGSIVGWGRNEEGQATPPAGDNYTAIAAGAEHSLALRQDGSIVGWGSDFFGQASPPAGNGFTAIAAGFRFSLALTDGVLGAPTNVRAVPGRRSATVSWIAPTSDAGSPIIGYEVTSSAHERQCSTTGELFCTVTGLTNGTPYTFTVTAINAIGVGPASAPSAPVVPEASTFGEFTPLTPARILDTRTGNGRTGVIAPLGENQSFPVQITGRGGVAPSGVAAVVMNVTVTEPTTASHLRLWPAGEDRPLVASLNFVAGQTVPNLVTVAVGANGRVNVYNRFGSTHVIFDVVGFYADDPGPAGSRFHAIAPFRYFDTREVDSGPFGPLGPDSVYEFNVLGFNDVPRSGVTAVMLNVAVTQPTARSFLTVFPGDVATRPLAANQNYVPGLTRSNQVIVRVPPSGVIKFYNRFGSVHLVVDAVGYFDEDRSTEAGRFIPLIPYRTYDSREGDEPWGPDEAWAIGTPSGFGGFTPDEAEAVVLNVTATQPNERSFLTVFPSHLCQVPLAASLNFGAGQTVPNHAVVRLGEDGQCSPPGWVGAIAVYNRFGTVHIVLDMFGFFTAPTNPWFD